MCRVPCDREESRIRVTRAFLKWLSMTMTSGVFGRRVSCGCGWARVIDESDPVSVHSQAGQVVSETSVTRAG